MGPQLLFFKHCVALFLFLGTNSPSTIMKFKMMKQIVLFPLASSLVRICVMNHTFILMEFF